MNNPESVKLEVFSFTLKPHHNNTEPSFKHFFEKYTGKTTKLFDEFAKLFIKQFDLKYKETKEKAFALSNNKTDYGFHQNCIWGVLMGGAKGAGKTKSEIGNKKSEDKLDGSVINDKYFFYLYLPDNKATGYLFFQIYGGESIRKEFVATISQLFKSDGDYLLPTCITILPNKIKEEFKENTIINELSYQQVVLASDISQEASFKNECSAYNIEINIKPVSPAKISSSKVNSINKVFQKYGLIANSKNTSNTKVVLENTITKKSAAFKLDVSDVMPRIYLINRVPIDANGTPNFAVLKTYCEGLLKELILGHYSEIKKK
jgi:hypothetical protein